MTDQDTMKAWTNMFLNLRDNHVSINSYRFPDATVTTQTDLIESIRTGQCLTATIDDIEILPLKRIYEDLK